MMFTKTYNSLGQLDSVYTIYNGIHVPLSYNSQDKTFDESDHLTIALREWEAENGKLDLSDRPIDPISLDQAKAQKKQEITSIAAAKQEELVKGFAPPEQASWTEKVGKAKAFLASGKIEDAGMLRDEAIAICQSQSDAVVLRYTQGLATKVLQKSEQMYSTSATIAGTRTRLLTAVEAAKTFEELNKIAWN
jgi:hypothetical protein